MDYDGTHHCMLILAFVQLMLKLLCSLKESLDLHPHHCTRYSRDKAFKLLTKCLALCYLNHFRARAFSAKAVTENLRCNSNIDAFHCCLYFQFS